MLLIANTDIRVKKGGTFCSRCKTIYNEGEANAYIENIYAWNLYHILKKIKRKIEYCNLKYLRRVLKHIYDITDNRL